MNWLLPRSLSGRIIALTLLALLVSQAVSFVIFVHERNRFQQIVILGGMRTRVAATVRMLDATPPADYAAVVRAADTPGLQYALTANNPLAGSTGNAQARELAAKLRTGLAGHITAAQAVIDTGPVRRHGRVQRGRPRAVVALRLRNGQWLAARQSVPDFTAHWAWTSLLTLVVSAVLMVAIVVASTRRLTRPLARLSGAAERFGRGEPVAALPEEGPEDIRRTTRAFNAMRERLQRFVTDRTRMLAAISHDLRTPITALRLRLELPDDEDNRRHMRETLDDMQRMAEAALEFARDATTGEAARPVDLAALIGVICEDARAQGRNVAFDEDRRVPFVCRPSALKRALRNVIENAAIYGGNATVAIDGDDAEVRVRVDDCGPGIPEAKMDTVFDPFVRLETSRSRNTGGNGLGLSIARTIAHAHGGEIELQNRPAGGLRVLVRMPRSQA